MSPIRRPEFLLIDGCDFQSFPIGGQLTSALNFMQAFGDRVGLVGMAGPGEPVGRWVRKRIGGGEFWFFGVRTYRKDDGKPLVPRRLSFYFALRAQREAILSLGCRLALLQAPESLLAVSDWGWESACYRMAGADNALATSRYGLGRLMAGHFERKFIDTLKRVDVILASADETSIARFVKRANGAIPLNRVVAFPTRVDTSLFHPAPMAQARAEIKVPLSTHLAVTVGRIGRFKGWSFLLDVLERFRTNWPDTTLIFVGDGEDRARLEADIAARHLGDCVRVTGSVPRRRVVDYLNAADLVLVGSEGEGWSLAMTEALACGKPLVSTDVSGASAMIQNGKNGFMVKQRDPDAFARAMSAALSLERAPEVSLALARRYSVSELRRDLLGLWPALAMAGDEPAWQSVESAGRPASRAAGLE